MALDTTRLRRRLPQPPIDGNPAMDTEAMPAQLAAPPRTKPEMEATTVPTDGRSLRATGRTVQLNIKISARTKTRFLALVQARGVLMTDLFEEAIALLEAQEAGVVYQPPKAATAEA